MWVPTGCWRESVKEVTNLEDLGIDRKILLKWDLNKLDKKNLAYWRATLNTAVKFRVP